MSKINVYTYILNFKGEKKMNKKYENEKRYGLEITWDPDHYNPIIHGTVEAIRIFYSENTTKDILAELRFCFGGTTIIEWTNPDEREKFADGIDGYTLFLDERVVVDTYKAEELLDEGKYRVLRVGNFFTNDSWYYSDLELDNDKYCDEGDLLFAWSASFGPRIWHGEKVIYHYHIWKVLPKKGKVDKMFLYYYLQYATPMWLGGTNGTTMVHITKANMEKKKVFIPSSVSEQKLIASVLTKYDELIENNENRIKCLEEMANSLYKEWFIRFRFPGHEITRMDNGIPFGWEYKKFSNPNGPTYAIGLSDVMAVNYENGDKDNFNNIESNTQKQKEHAYGLIEKTADNSNITIIAQHNRTYQIKNDKEKQKSLAKYCLIFFGAKSSSIMSNEDIEMKFVRRIISTPYLLWSVCPKYCISIRNKTDRTVYIDKGNCFRLYNT